MNENELHTMLENALVLLRMLVNEYHQDMDDADLLKALDIIRGIERIV